MLAGRVLAAGVLAIAALGGNARSETLDDALIQAYANNPTLLAERARLRSTDEGVTQALSNWRPVVTVNGNLGYEWQDRTITAGVSKSSTSTTPRGATLSVDQNIYRGGRTAAATRRAKYLVQSDRARLATTEQNVLLSAVTAYVDVVCDQSVVELNVNNEKVLKRQLEAAHDRFRVGEVTRTDVAQAESRLSRARADRIAAEGALVQSRSTYKNVVGTVPGKLEATKSPGSLPVSEADAVNMARGKSFAVLQSDYTERAARETVSEVKGELLPTLTVSGELSREIEIINPNSETDTASVTARLTVPLYQSGSVYSRVRAAKQTVAQRRNERNQAVRDAVEEATRAWEAHETAQAQIRAFNAEVEATRIALEGVKQEALVGSRTVLDVLDAEQELLNALVSLARADRDQVVAAYRLRAAVGQLIAQELKLPVSFYDPKRNYRRVRTKLFGTGTESK